MTEITDRITPEMSEEEVLGVILDEIMARAEPDVAEAIRFCAIPHWFNEEIIAWLRGEGLNPSPRSHEILTALIALTFVGPYHERGWAYHENVRDLLLRGWRERDGKAFKELSGQTAEYFEHTAEAAPDEERDAWEREQIYHLLAADPEQGFELFRRMFNMARNFYQLSTCALLLELAEEQEAHLSVEDQIWLRFHQGQLARVSAQWPEALRIFQELWREELSPSLEGTLANDLGLLYHDKGDWDRAIGYYERSLAIKERMGAEREMAATFSNLGNVYQDKSEWDRAIEYYERSLEIMERVGAVHLVARIFNNLGSAHQAKGEWERAMEYCERSLEITQKIGDEYVISRTFNILGEVYRAKGEWERAMEYCKRSLAIREKMGDEYGMAYIYNNMALLYQAQGRLEEAIPLFEKSIAIVERIGDEYHAKLGRESLEKAKQELEAKTGQA
jgi:tetratricopeptide (TPR) repeat protein